MRLFDNNIPIYERPTDEWLEEVIAKLESRKDYGVEIRTSYGRCHCYSKGEVWYR